MKTGNRRISIVAAALIAAASIVSCRKDAPEPAKEPVIPVIPDTTSNDSTQANRPVYILNEGSFGSGKGSVSVFLPGTGQVVEDYYAQQNNGGALGDVVQSVIRHKDEYFVVVNNSGKIVVCDLHFVKKTEIPGFLSPRYIQPVGGDLAYVSDMKSGKLTVVNLAARAIVNEVPLAGFSEGMLLHGDMLYVTNTARNFLYKVDPVNHKVLDSIVVGPGGSGVLADKNGKLWVLSGGDYFTQTPGALSRVDPGTWTVEAAFAFSQDAFASELCLSPGKDTLYFLDNGIHRMSIDAASLPASPVVPAGSRMFYALKIHPRTHHIYASDAIDYVQRSSVIVYDTKGSALKEFKAGVISTDFYFD